MKNIKTILVGIVLVAVGVVGGSAFSTRAAEVEDESLAVSKATPEAIESEVIDVEDDTQDAVKVTKAEYVESVTEYTREYLTAEISALIDQKIGIQARIDELQTLLNQLP